ncbi:hypothetical protein K501DRAFT_263295 [Backusella circina FSU 941]|nr:hypothetical protein K501DRAFT_263295 [Backusella circina FSU 941]
MAGPLFRTSNLLNLPLEIFLKISASLSFSDLWYFATSSRRCRALAHQIIWHKYHIDLTRPHLNAFNHFLHSALAFVERHGYINDSIDHTVLQSVSNRLAVEFYDRSPLKNWEPCLDFFLDKTLGITLDHVLIDANLDTVPRLPLIDFQALCSMDKNIVANIDHDSEHYPTRKGQLLCNFITTLYPTLAALFDTEKTIKIHHRLLLTHLNRHLDTLTSRYHSHYKRRIMINLSPKSNRASALLAAQIHNQYIQLKFRILIRFIGTLVQADLLTSTDVDTITSQRIQPFFLSYGESNTPTTESSHKRRAVSLPPSPPLHPLSHKPTEPVPKPLKYCSWPLWLEEVEFQMSILVDLIRAVLSRQSPQWGPSKELHMVATMLNDTVSNLISQNTPSPHVILPTTQTSTSTAV